MYMIFILFHINYTENSIKVITKVIISFKGSEFHISLVSHYAPFHAVKQSCSLSKICYTCCIVKLKLKPESVQLSFPKKGLSWGLCMVLGERI